MAAFNSTFQTDLAKPSRVVPIPDTYTRGDNESHTITVLVYDSENPSCGLMAGSVSAAVARQDGNTIPLLTGTKGAATVPVKLADGSTAQSTPCTVTLKQACFDCPGQVVVVIRLVSGETITSIFVGSGKVNEGLTNSIIDPGDVITDITALIAAAEQAAEDAEEALAQASEIVSYAEQTGKTDAQKAQARTNIGAASEGDVTDLRGAVSNITSHLGAVENLETTIFFDQTISGVGTVTVNVNIPAGAYSLHIDNITSDDTDYDVVTFTIYSGNTALFNKNYSRGVAIDEMLYLTQDATKIMCMASRYIGQSAGDAFEFTGVVISKDATIKQFAEDIDAELEVIKDDNYTYSAIGVSKTSSSYRLRDDGICVSDANYALKYYAVNEGTEIKIVSDDKFQFQSSNSVPTLGPNSALKSKTYGSGKYLVKVPTGATYLVISTTTDGTASAFSATPEVDNIRKEMKEYDIAKVGVGKTLKNLIEIKKCVIGTLTITGEYSPTGNEYVTDFIPVNVDNIYRSASLQPWVYYYNSSKEFLYREANPLSIITNTETAYIRVRIAPANVNLAKFGYAQNWNKQDLNGYIYGSATPVMNTIIDQSYSTYAQSNSNQYKGSGNLFDYVNDVYFIKSKINNDGSYAYAEYDSDVPDGTNGYIATFTFYPVQYGKVLFCNYYLWSGAFYDETKQFVSGFSATPAGEGIVVPEGASFVRVNIKATTTVPKPKDCIGNISEMKNFMLYTVDGSQELLPTKKTVPAKYQLDGAYVSANYLDKVVPSMEDSEFLSAMKCMTIREMNKRDHAFRFGNFNMWVTTNAKGWENTRKMLMDYGVDFCGFEEVYKSNDQLISKFMQSWQFPYGFNSNFTDGEDAIDKSFVSRYEILSSTKFWTTSSGSSVAGLNCKIKLPRYLDVYNPSRILSVYVVHLPITTDAHKLSVANEILDLVAEDTSDFVMIFGDTNDFSATEEGKLYWRTFEAAGFRPVIPIDTKTVTQDSLTVVVDDPSNQWRHHSIDQFCVSSNIELVSYGVVNTKDEYFRDDISGPATDNEPALSDHDFIYCDLRFKYNEPRSGLTNDG